MARKKGSGPIPIEAVAHRATAKIVTFHGLLLAPSEA